MRSATVLELQGALGELCKEAFRLAAGETPIQDQNGELVLELPLGVKPAEAQKLLDRRPQGETLGETYAALIQKYSIEGGARPDDDWKQVDAKLTLVKPSATSTTLRAVVSKAEIEAKGWFNWKKFAMVIAGALIALATATVVQVACIAAMTPAVGAGASVPCAALAGAVAGGVATIFSEWADGNDLHSGDTWSKVMAAAFIGALVGAGLEAAGYAKWLDANKTNIIEALRKLAKPVFDKAASWFGKSGEAVQKGLTVLGDAIKGLGSKIDSMLHSGASLRVMPLGDSITAGVGSTDDAGYRNDLWDALKPNTASLDFVGSRREGKMGDPDNEGHRGRRIDEIARVADCSVPSSRPNVVTLHAGTNDMNQNHALDAAPERIGNLIDQILQDAPETVVLVATLVPATKAGLQPRIDRFNADLPAVVKKRADQGKHVRLVSMDAVSTADLFNAAHPNDNGYAKMANAWNKAIGAAAKDGWIQKPKGGTGAKCAAPAGGGGEGDESKAGPGWRSLGVVAPGMSSPAGRTDLVDLNGDQRADYVRIAADGSVRAALNKPGEPGKPKWEDQGTIVGAPPGETNAGDKVRFADIDGDGADDYLIVGDDSSVKAWLTNPSSFKPLPRGVIAPGVKGATRESIRFADVDGDGRDDYLRVGESGAVHAYINTPKDGGNTITWKEHLNWAPGVSFGSRAKLRFGDVNGDKRADYLIVGNTGAVHAFLNDGLGNGFTEKRNFVNETGFPGDKAAFRDISGDGKADYVVVYDGGSVRCWLNLGGNT